MNSVEILYQDEILKYGRKPNNLGVLDDANLQLHGDSPICGDHMRLYLRVTDGHVAAVRFSSSACCALCLASASMMTDAINGMSIAGVRQLRRQFLAMLAGDEDAEPEPRQDLGRLRVFERIREVPSRSECVSLSWNTLGTLLSTASISITKDYDNAAQAAF
jgi:nitrogen fixation protein NifU and related proteins